MTEGRAEIELLGQRLTVRGQGSPEYIRSLAEYLDSRIQTLRIEARVHEPMRLSLLASLHVVDELFRTREREKAVAARIDTLVERLGQTLGGA